LSAVVQRDKRRTNFVTNPESGAYLILADEPEAPTVRRYLLDHGTTIVDDSSHDRLNLRGALIATGVFVGFLLILLIGTALAGR
jgi:hypothetical protein